MRAHGSDSDTNCTPVTDHITRGTAIHAVWWSSGVRSGRELLMTLGIVSCFHFYLTFRRLEEQGGGGVGDAVTLPRSLRCCSLFEQRRGCRLPQVITTWDV